MSKPEPVYEQVLYAIKSNHSSYHSEMRKETARTMASIDLMKLGLGLTREQSERIVTAIESGHVKHVSIDLPKA